MFTHQSNITSLHTQPQREETADRKTRLALAFVVAATSDLISYGTELVPPVQWAVDRATAFLLPALVAEAIPGIAALPVWTLVVAALALWGRIR